ncbi:MAG: aminopeptidase P family N-terminal domain-containing protein [Anaerostipes hadrus]
MPSSLSSLPDIAWLFNLRGDDIACTPLFYSYAWITIGPVLSVP